MKKKVERKGLIRNLIIGEGGHPKELDLAQKVISLK